MLHWTLFQEHRPVFPVDVATEVYDPSLVDHHSNHHSSTAVVNASGSWTNKRGVSKTSHQHNLVCPPQQQQQQQPQLQHVSQPTHHHHHHHHHHLTVPNHRSQQDAKKEPTQLSPVKKRVKEGTPPSGMCAWWCKTRSLREYCIIFKCKTKFFPLNWCFTLCCQTTCKVVT